MKSKRFWLLASMAAVLFGLPSCSSDSETKENNPPAELKITASMAQSLEVTTRAAHNLQGTSLNDPTNVGIYVWYTGYTAAKSIAPVYNGYPNVKVSSSTGTGPYTLTPSQTLGFPIDNADVDVYLYAPFKTSPSQTAMCMTHTVATDQSLTAGYIDSDFIYGKATADYTSKTASVTMHHAMSKIIFKVVNEGVDPANMTNITLNNAYKTTTINMPQAIPGGGMTCGSSGTDNVGVATTLADITAWTSASGSGISTSDIETNGVAIIVPPQTTDASSTVTVIINDNTSNKTATAAFNGKTLDPGKVYTFNLKLVGTSLTISLVSIVDWDSSAAAEDLNFSTWT